MKVAVGLRRVAAGKRTSGRRAAQIAVVDIIRDLRQALPYCFCILRMSRSVFTDK